MPYAFAFVTRTRVAWRLLRFAFFLESCVLTVFSLGFLDATTIYFRVLTPHVPTLLLPAAKEHNAVVHHLRDLARGNVRAPDMVAPRRIVPVRECQVLVVDPPLDMFEGVLWGLRSGELLTHPR